MRPPLTTRGWGKYNPHYWQHGGYADFVQWWAERMLPEPHSTKQIEDAIAWSLDTDGSTLAAQRPGRRSPPRPPAGTRSRSRERVAVPGARHPRDEGPDHPVRATARRSRRSPAAGSRPSRARATCPHARKPVQVNLAMREFVEGAPRRDPTVHRSDGRKRALYISSPIGLGHAQRDVAIARELRSLVDGLEIDWLAQDPVTRVLAGRGRAHPSGQRAPGQRVPPHRVGVRRARPALLPGDPPDGRDPDQQLHGLPRRRARGPLRPLGRRRGLGARLLPAREPAREAGSLRLDDRLRRLAADARRRRARGLPDRRLQRRDGRAHRRASRAPRPGGLRRQPRGHRRRAPRPGAADDPRLDRAQLRVRRLRHRLRPAQPRRPRRAAPRARLPARREGLHRQRRRLGRRRRPAAPGDRLLRGREASGARAADDRRRRAAHRPRARCRSPTASRSSPTSTTSTATSPPATSPWSRAASPPRWS